jgi:hypothetical protein
LPYKYSKPSVWRTRIATLRMVPRRKRRRIVEGDSQDISEVSTLVDVSTTTSPGRTAGDGDDDDIEIMSRIDPLLLKDRLERVK